MSRNSIALTPKITLIDVFIEQHIVCSVYSLWKGGSTLSMGFLTPTSLACPPFLLFAVPTGAIVWKLRPAGDDPGTERTGRVLVSAQRPCGSLLFAGFNQVEQNICIRDQPGKSLPMHLNQAFNFCACLHVAALVE